MGTYNKKHGITPETIKKEIHDILSSIYERDYYTVPALPDEERDLYIPPEEIPGVIARLEKEMWALAKRLEFERAAEIRDRIRALQEKKMGVLER